MASAPPAEPPVIWLLSPSALAPPPTPLRPLPIAISLTLTTLFVIFLVILYRRAPRPTATTTSTAQQDLTALTTLKDKIRILRPQSATQPREPPGTSSSSSSSSSSLPPRMQPEPSDSAASLHPRHSPTPSQVKNGSSGSSDPQVMTYHEALKDIRDAPYYPSHGSVPNPFVNPSPSVDSHYSTPDASTNSRSQYNSPTKKHISIAASSNYSVSLDPTPLPSRRNSLRNRDYKDPWTRLRLGSEYDGDRTFVASEANLQLGKG